MTSNALPTRLPAWPGLTGYRLAALCAGPLFFLLSGVVYGSETRAIPGALRFLGSVALWWTVYFVTVHTTKGDGAESWEPPIGAGTIFWGGTAFGLLGTAAGGALAGYRGAPFVYLAPVPFAALFCVLMGRAAWKRRIREIQGKRRDAERKRRLDEEAAVVRGVITELESRGPHYDGNPWVEVTVRFTAADGVEYTETVTRKIHVLDMPKPGRGVTIRHLPDSPSDFDLEIDREDGA